MSGSLTHEGIARAAALIGCGVPEMAAVIQVEALGEGFLADGRPKILFERHKFHQFTGGVFDVVAPRVSNAKAGGYETPAGEYTRLYIAQQLAPEMATQCASWGIGQVMGYNWALAGEKSLIGFLLAAHHNADAQLMLMAHFIRSVGADDELRQHDWAGFARLYNGTGYARNKYDVKLSAAFKAITRSH